MKKKVIAGVIVLLVLLGIVGYNYLYQDHRDIDKEEPIAELNTESISQMFKQTGADELLNSTVSVKGSITEIEGNVLTLDDKVSSSFDELAPDLEIGDVLVIKGRCIGYDDLFEIVKLDQCSILK